MWGRALVWCSCFKKQKSKTKIKRRKNKVPQEKKTRKKGERRKKKVVSCSAFEFTISAGKVFKGVILWQAYASILVFLKS